MAAPVTAVPPTPGHRGPGQFLGRYLKSSNPHPEGGVTRAIYFHSQKLPYNLTFLCVWEWDYTHCAWESNYPLLVRTSEGAHIPAHALPTVQLRNPRSPDPKSQTPPLCQRHHSSVDKSYCPTESNPLLGRRRRPQAREAAVSDMGPQEVIILLTLLTDIIQFATADFTIGRFYLSETEKNDVLLAWNVFKYQPDLRYDIIDGLKQINNATGRPEKEVSFRNKISATEEAAMNMVTFSMKFFENFGDEKVAEEILRERGDRYHLKLPEHPSIPPRLTLPEHSSVPPRLKLPESPFHSTATNVAGTSFRSTVTNVAGTSFCSTATHVAGTHSPTFFLPTQVIFLFTSCRVLQRMSNLAESQQIHTGIHFSYTLSKLIFAITELLAGSRYKGYLGLFPYELKHIRKLWAIIKDDKRAHDYCLKNYGLIYFERKMNYFKSFDEFLQNLNSDHATEEALKQLVINLSAKDSSPVESFLDILFRAPAYLIHYSPVKVQDKEIRSLYKGLCAVAAKILVALQDTIETSISLKFIQESDDGMTTSGVNLG
uniref:Uncharacterized protein n=1 Tax=Timema bartmani TaxID=61472 RepID=A0A7R9ERE2_9NEOP|nr:unnamed protein product [Timema bartmani]